MGFQGDDYQVGVCKREAGAEVPSESGGSTVQGSYSALLPNRPPAFFSSFSFISLIADGPHHYHPACGHKESSYLSPVHALQFFIAMHVQHSYNSSTNG